jgi:hypothetical protein
MKHILVLIIGVVAAGSLAAQNFSWGAYVYPNYSSRRLIILGSNIGESQIQALEEQETGKLSLSAGLQAGWRAEKIGFRFGLAVSETGYQTVKEAIPEDDPNPLGASQRRVVYRNYNLVLPVEIDFIHQIDSKNAFVFLLGGAASYNLGNEVKEVFYLGDTRERQEGALPEGTFRSTNFAIMSGMGWERKLSEGMHLMLQPTFHFWLSGMLEEAPVNRSLYDVGVKVGVLFR